MTTRTRFAPSPTGELHLGNARIAVLNWLYARHTDGAFVLRVEDTDVERNLPGAEREMLSALRRLGLDWDEGPDVGGPHGPYRQSERSAVYARHVEPLLEHERAYRCYCSPETLARKRDRAIARGEDPIYDGTCRTLDPETERRHREAGVEPSIRFRVPEGEIRVHDRVRGEIAFGPGEFGDFVIVKSDGRPTYNFAVVVDDATMEISHVVRGAGHLSNTPRQLLVYEALGYAPPVFVHVPHVLGPDGEPLSKRHGARSLEEYLDLGYPPEAIVNYLSLLSWSSPSGDEHLEIDRLIREIDLDRIGSSDVRLDPDKLDWLAGEHIRAMAVDELTERLGPWLPEDLAPADAAHVAAGVQERIQKLSDVRDYLPQFRPPDPMRWSPEAEEALSDDGVGPVLRAVRDGFARLEGWDGDAAVAAVREAGKAIEVGGRRLFMPVRAAVSGHTRGPELNHLFAVQGRETAIRTLDQAMARFGGDDDGA